MKLKVFSVAICALAALVYATAAGAPNRPPPSNCPTGYERDGGSSDRQLLCTRTVTRDREVVREVPGPERVVIKEVPGPERVVEKIVFRDRVVVKFKTKIKRVVQIKTKRVVKWRTRYIQIEYCRRKHDLAG